MERNETLDRILSLSASNKRHLNDNLDSILKILTAQSDRPFQYGEEVLVSGQGGYLFGGYDDNGNIIILDRAGNKIDTVLSQHVSLPGMPEEVRLPGDSLVRDIAIDLFGRNQDEIIASYHEEDQEDFVLEVTRILAGSGFVKKHGQEATSLASQLKDGNQDFINSVFRVVDDKFVELELAEERGEEIPISINGKDFVPVAPEEPEPEPEIVPEEPAVDVFVSAEAAKPLLQDVGRAFSESGDSDDAIKAYNAARKGGGAEDLLAAAHSFRDRVVSRLRSDYEEMKSKYKDVSALDALVPTLLRKQEIAGLSEYLDPVLSAWQKDRSSKMLSKYRGDKEKDEGIESMVGDILSSIDADIDPSSPDLNTEKTHIKVAGVLDVPVERQENGKYKVGVETRLLKDTLRVFLECQQQGLTGEDLTKRLYDDFFKKRMEARAESLEKVTLQKIKYEEELGKDPVEDDPAVEKALLSYRFYNQMESDLIGLYHRVALQNKISEEAFDYVMDKAGPFISEKADPVVLRGVRNLSDLLSDEDVEEVIRLNVSAGYGKQDAVSARKTIADQFPIDRLLYYEKTREHTKMRALQGELLQFSENVQGVSVFCRTCGRFRVGSVDLPGPGEYWNKWFCQFWDHGGRNGYVWRSAKDAPAEEETPRERDGEIIFSKAEEALLSEKAKEILRSGCSRQNESGEYMCDPVQNLYVKRDIRSAPVHERCNFTKVMNVGGKEITYGNNDEPLYVHETYYDRFNEIRGVLVSNNPGRSVEIDELLFDLISLSAVKRSDEERGDLIAARCKQVFDLLIQVIRAKDTEGALDDNKIKLKALRNLWNIIPPDFPNTELLAEVTHTMKSGSAKDKTEVTRLEQLLGFVGFADDLSTLPIDPVEAGKTGVASYAEMLSRDTIRETHEVLNEYISDLAVRAFTFGLSKDEMQTVMETELRHKIHEALGMTPVVVPKLVDDMLKPLQGEKDKERRAEIIKQWDNAQQEISRMSRAGELERKAIEKMDLMGFSLSEAELAETTRILLKELFGRLEPMGALYKKKQGGQAPNVLDSTDELLRDYQTVRYDQDERLYQMLKNFTEKTEALDPAGLAMAKERMYREFAKEHKEVSREVFEANLNSAIFSTVTKTESRRGVKETSDAIERVAEEAGLPADVVLTMYRAHVSNTKSKVSLKDNLPVLSAFVEVGRGGASFERAVNAVSAGIRITGRDVNEQDKRMFVLSCLKSDLERLIAHDRKRFLKEDEEFSMEDVFIGKASGGHFSEIDESFIDQVKELLASEGEFQQSLSELMVRNPEAYEEFKTAYEKKYNVSSTTSFQPRLPAGEVYPTSIPPVPPETENYEQRVEERTQELRKQVPAKLDDFIKKLVTPEQVSYMLLEMEGEDDSTFLGNRGRQVLSLLSLNWLLNPRNRSKVNYKNLYYLAMNARRGQLVRESHSQSMFTSKGPDKVPFAHYIFRDIDVEAFMSCPVGISPRTEEKILKKKRKERKKGSKSSNWYKFSQTEQNSGDPESVLIYSDVDILLAAKSAAVNGRTDSLDQTFIPAIRTVPFEKFGSLSNVLEFDLSSPFSAKVLTKGECGSLRKMGLID